MAKRFIDADELELEYYGLSIHGTIAVKSVLPIFADLLEKQPTAEVAEVRRGKWVHTDYAMHWLGKDECSECTYHTSDRDDLSHFNFCPNCGARMDGDDGETV